MLSGYDVWSVLGLKSPPSTATPKTGSRAIEWVFSQSCGRDLAALRGPPWRSVAGSPASVSSFWPIAICTVWRYGSPASTSTTALRSSG